MEEISFGGVPIHWYENALFVCTSLIWRLQIGQSGRHGDPQPTHRQRGNHQLWGLSVQDEKEIVLILTACANKVALMKCIGESCGMYREAQEILLSMPIDSVAGI